MDSFIDEARTPTQRRVAACVDGWRHMGDRRALFGVTHAMAVDSVMALTRAGRFMESAWVLRLMEAWAEYYLVTIDASGDDLSAVTPAAWADAHAAASDPRTAPVDAVMLGLNAHVNNDLAQAISDVLRDEWPVPPGRLQARTADVTRMLGVFADTVDGVQCIIGRFDARLMSGRYVQVVRSSPHDAASLCAAWLPQVWEDAMVLVTAADGAWLGAIREGVECTAARRGHALLCRIDEGALLLTAPGRELDRRFPHRHAAAAGCRLNRGAPVWGGTPVIAH